MPNKKEIIVGIDLGGTSIKALAVDGRNKILATGKKKTEVGQKPKVLIKEIAKLVEEAAKDAGLRMKGVVAVSIGAPGAIDVCRGVVTEAPNLHWKNVPLASELRLLLGTPVMVDNDVNVGVMGEHALGAGERVDNLVGVFVGTGIGGGIIIGGKLFEGTNGWAGEVGHTVLMVDGPVCSCGRRGCAEALASRTAIERDVLEAIKAGAKSAVPEIMKERQKDRITSSVLQAALAKNDPVVKQVMKRAELYLGILVGNIVNALDPQRVIIGGGIAARLGEDFVGPIRATAYEHFLHAEAAKRTKVMPGTLGDDAGALGAVVLARKRMRL
ncbi:MAG TPA: ROK family protein [Terriglobia bacterium]|nr:ROK family protein [Terriglobia bacterium]